MVKNRKAITTTLPIKTYEQLKSISSKTCIPISKLFEMAMNDILKKYSDLIDKDLL